MAKSLAVASSPAWMQIADGLTRYFVIANAPLLAEATEANTQITHHTAGTMSNLHIRVAQNTLIDPGDGSGDSTVRTRKNGANGGQTITVFAATTGEYEASGTDTIADGDEFNGLITVPTQAGAKFVSLSVCSIVFDATSGDTSLRHAATNFVDMSDGNSYVYALADNGDVLNTLFAYAEFTFRAAGTIKNLFVKVSSNGNTSAGTNTVVTVYKNQVATAVTINVPANEVTQTVFEDTSNSVTVVAGDKISLVVDSVNSGAVLLEIGSVEWVSTNSKFHSIFAYSGGGMTQNFATDDFLPIGGGGIAWLLEPEADNKTEMQIACTVSNLEFYISANTINSLPGAGPGANTYVRKNGVNTIITKNVPEGSTGFFEDDVNSVVFAAADEINIRSDLAGLTGSMIWRYAGILIENTEGAASGEEYIIITS